MFLCLDQVDVAGGRRDRRDDGRLGSPAQRVLQQTGQLRLPEKKVSKKLIQNFQ
jgi:hypothetical protein